MDPKDLPMTHQAMKDYIRYAEKEIKSNELKNKRLNEAIQYLTKILETKQEEVGEHGI